MNYQTLIDLLIHSLIWSTVGMAPFWICMVVFLKIDHANWETVAELNGYRYQQHRTKRKRRCWRLSSPSIRTDWLKYETDELS